MAGKSLPIICGINYTKKLEALNLKAGWLDKTLNSYGKMGCSIRCNFLKLILRKCD